MYYTDDANLSDSQRSIAERWELAFSLLQKHKSRKIAVIKLMAAEKIKGNTLSNAQAYRDVKKAEQLFVPLRKYSKDLLRHVLIESAMQDLEEIKERMSDKPDDLGNKNRLSDAQWIKLMETKHKVEFRLIELSGLDEDNSDMPDFSKLEVHNYEIKLPEGTAKMLKNIVNQGVVDATDLARTLNAEDVEDLNDEESEE